MAFVTRRLPGFEGVAAGNTATLRVPLGPTYHQIYIPYSGATLAQLTNITVSINGIEFMRFRSGVELDRYNQYCGKAAASGVLTIDFEREVRTKALRELTAVGTVGAAEDGGVIPTTLTVSVDIAAAATAPALPNPHARTSAPRGLGALRKFRTFSLDASITGENEFANIPRNNLISRIFMDEAAVTAITRLKVDVNQNEIFDRSDALNALIQADLSEGDRVPQPDLYVVDFIESRDGDNALNAIGAQDFRLKATVTAGGAVPTSVEYLGNLEG
jgi:hypothetical protein